MDITYEAINGSNRAGVNAFLEDHWGGTVMAVRGENGIRIEHELEFVKELKQGRSAPLRG